MYGKSLFKAVLLGTLFCFTMASCEKDEFDANEKGNLVLEFDNVVGNQDLLLNTGTYTNAMGEQFTLSLFQYYISNIQLKTEDGRMYVIPVDESYFIVQENQAHTHSIFLKDVPAGRYTQVSFVIGVDSLRNTMDPSQRTGVLDVANYTGAEKMYWSWNSGYIFVKVEGESPQAPVGSDGQRKFRYHVGGFGGYSSPTINNIKVRELALGSEAAIVKKSKTPEVHIKVDVLKLFNGTTNLSIAANPTVHFAPFSVNIANNYAHMFSVDHVHN